MRRILGIDPGSRITGFGIIEQKEMKTQPICILGGCIRLVAKEIPPRLGQLFAEIQALVQTYQPTELAIEEVFVHKNAHSALKLGQARGVAIAAVMAVNLPVYEYAPRRVKQAIVGRGAADKAQVQHMIQILLALNDKPQADAADALAVALCHLHSISISDELKVTLPSRKKYARRKQQWKSYDRTITRKID